MGGGTRGGSGARRSGRVDASHCYSRGSTDQR